MASWRNAARRKGHRTRPPGPRDLGCNKVVFLTRSGADAAAVLHGERHMVATRAYRCPFGHGWHLTTQARRSA